MAVFSVLGAQKALMMGMSIPVSAIMGIFSACLGGIIRDVILNDVPVVFRKEIYITASLLGALVYCFITVVSLPKNTQLATYVASEPYAIIGGCIVAFAIRAFAITHNLSMPAHKGID